MSVWAQIRSTKAAGKHPHSEYSHCNERMLLITKKEDGSSLRRTHPHITRPVKEGARCCCSQPCMRTDCHSRLTPRIKRSGNRSEPRRWSFDGARAHSAEWSESDVTSRRYKPDIIIVLLRTGCVMKGKTCPPPIFLCISNSPDG